MVDMEIEADVSTEKGLFFGKEISWKVGGKEQSITTPAKITPTGCVTGNDSIDESVHDIGEVYVEINTADLEAYRSGGTPPSITNLHSKLRDDMDGIQVVFFEYTDSPGITFEEIKTMVRLQQQHADIITFPCQPSLTDALSPDLSGDGERFEHPPYPAYRNAVEYFLEITCGSDVNKPVMGVLPPFGFSRRREILKLYEDFGIQLIAVDFRGLKPTKPAHYNRVKKLIADLTVRGEIQSRVLYAFNHRPYFVRRNSNLHPSEDVALIGSGFDIIGGTHIHRGGGDFGDGSPPPMKIFEPLSWGYRNVPLDSLESNWPVASTIRPGQVAPVGDKKQREFRKLINSEGLSRAFQIFREVLKQGNEREFLRKKEGVSNAITVPMEEMVAKYEDARQPNLPGI